MGDEETHEEDEEEHVLMQNRSQVDVPCGTLEKGQHRGMALTKGTTHKRYLMLVSVIVQHQAEPLVGETCSDFQ